MKPCVMQLLVALRPGGAERLALTLLDHGKDIFRGCVAALIFPPDKLKDMADELDIPSFALRSEGAGKVSTVLALYRLLRKQRVTLLHAQASYLLPYAAAAARLAGIPLVCTEHSTHELETTPRLRRTFKIAAPFAQAIVCVSEHLAQYVTGTLGIASNRVRVIPNGVDLARFTPLGPKAASPWNGAAGQAPVTAKKTATPGNAPGAAGKPVVFGTVARLCEDKDHENLLYAFALLAREYPEARLLIAGDGEKRAGLENMARELGLEDRAHFAGMCLDVPARMRSMDIFVLSSKWEGFPMVLLEAMACGLPVISTGVGGIPRLNEGGENLLLVPPQNAEALALAMRRLLRDITARRTFAQRGFTLARAEYGAEHAARRYFQLYKDIGGLP